jgi:peptide chain release factor 3
MPDTTTMAEARPGTAPAEGTRRTFAIISHPDAGKTTLTEKILLTGGAIRLAGAVKAKGEARRARSDWMKIERERGISVTSSVMTFEYRDLVMNLLDTPGHEDFSEDTYRTLTAVDSAVMVIDAARGIEAQTLKLFEVCRLRDIPIITFINKVDREGRDPFELIDEIQDRLALDASPMVWPVGMGTDFHGCFDFRTNSFLTAKSNPSQGFNETVPLSGLGDPALDGRVNAQVLEHFRENAELAREAYPAFDADAYRAGHLTPIVFGSALRDYSVAALVDLIAAHAPPPRPQPADTRVVEPSEAAVTGFVFKVQANMDPNHRDRVAFLRLCSGRFKRGMKLKQVHGGKTISVNNPVFFFAQERALAEEAQAGDIIGIPNHGVLRVGDTLTEGEDLRFTGIPNFAPEILRRVQLEDPIRSKQMRRALEDLAEEGVAQVFRPLRGADWIVGVVGALQLDVLTTRIAGEYKVAVRFEQSPYEAARWIAADDKAELDRFIERYRSNVALDRDEAPVFLAGSTWELNHAMEKWPKIRFSATRERT